LLAGSYSLFFMFSTMSQPKPWAWGESSSLAGSPSLNRQYLSPASSKLLPWSKSAPNANSFRLCARASEPMEVVLSVMGDEDFSNS